MKVKQVLTRHADILDSHQYNGVKLILTTTTYPSVLQVIKSSSVRRYV